MRPVLVIVCPPSGGSCGLNLVLSPAGSVLAVDPPLARSSVGLVAACMAWTQFVV